MKLRPIATNFTLKDHVYERLREAITQMDIYASDADLRLDERSMADQLQVSRTPLREALTRLEQDGFIDRAWPFDIIPRIIDAKEWQVIEAGPPTNPVASVC